VFLWAKQSLREGSSMASFGAALRMGLALAVLTASGCASDHGGAGAPAVSRVTTPPSVAATFPDPVTKPFSAATSRALQEVLTGAVANYTQSHAVGVPGITAAVLSDQGSWTGAAGTGGDGARLTPNAMMAVDSITKTFIAAEVMRLAAAGKVDLDASLSTYLPQSLTARGATVRQTLSMRSGLADPPAAVFESLAGAQAATPAKHWTAQQTLAYLKPASAAPGGVPVYANSNYLLLGLLIEKVTGRTVAQVERTDVFTPAGLSRIAAQDGERPTAPLAAPPRTLHLPADGYLPSESLAGSGQDSFSGIAADAGTVAKWGYQLYGARLLPVGSVRAMMTQPSVGDIAAGRGYALGTMVFSGLCSDATYGHSGADPGYTTLLAVVPARHLAAAVLIPDNGRDTDSIMRDLLAVLG
jgi:D-alanyl-D-alanine carboxypeptidase